MRNKIIAGNWKMNKTSDEASSFASALKKQISGFATAEIIICPPFTALATVYEILKDTRVKVGAQNVYWEPSGAYTGEVSAQMIENAGGDYVIIGHSERRQYFEETNQTVNKKIKQTLTTHLNPIVCIGETLQQRQDDKTRDVVTIQIEEGFKGLTVDQMSRIIIAYEPVWAIGTGVTATPEQAEEVHQFIRELILKDFNSQIADTLYILYGGSVTPANIRELLIQKNIDGGLIGGASLKVDSFVAMIKIAEEILN